VLWITDPRECSTRQPPLSTTSLRSVAWRAAGRVSLVQGGIGPHRGISLASHTSQTPQSTASARPFSAQALRVMPSLKEIRNRVNDIVCGNRVVFHHLPKCGGTSVRRTLRLSYPLSYAGFGSNPTYRAMEALHPDRDETWIRNATLDFREKQLLCFLFDDVRCIAGHVPFCETAYDLFKERYNFITTLREPVSLIISLFFLRCNEQRGPMEVRREH
jgi:hypothetical protein